MRRADYQPSPDNRKCLGVLIRQAAPLSPPFHGAACFCVEISLSAEAPLDRGNSDDRRRWRKQGVAVGAAASKTQAERGGCWEPQPGLVERSRLRGCTEESLSSVGKSGSWHLLYLFVELYVIMVLRPCPPIYSGGEVRKMESILSFILSVGANVAAYYIC